MIRYFTVLFVLLFVPLSVSSVFGTVEDFTTNKSLYHEGDQISISGNVSYDPSNPFIIIQIITPDQTDIAGIDQIIASSDGSFSSNTIHAGGSKWNIEGDYTIKVIYDGFLEKSIEYKKSPTASQSTPESIPESTHTSEPTTESEQTLEHSVTSESFLTLFKSEMPTFPSLGKSPQYYVDRYENEPEYRMWFNSNFPSDSISEVVGYPPTHIENFPSSDKSPQYYLDRYHNESDYKKWFDSQFPDVSIYKTLGYDFQLDVPEWVLYNAHWWSQNLISENDLENSINFLIEEGIIVLD